MLEETINSIVGHTVNQSCIETAQIISEFYLKSIIPELDTAVLVSKLKVLAVALQSCNGTVTCVTEALNILVQRISQSSEWACQCMSVIASNPQNFVELATWEALLPAVFLKLGEHSFSVHCLVMLLCM